MNVELQET